MENTLVTGGAGFLGSAIVHELSKRGNTTIRVLALPHEPLDNLEDLRDIEVVRGDILSREDALRAVQGINTVYHCAAIYKDYMPDPSPIYQVNLRGTFNVLEAARRTNVEKVIYTSSVVALGRPKAGQVADENSPYEAWSVNFHYSRSKHLSMLTALDFASWGLDVRIVCPSVLFGPGDITPTPSGRLILDVCHRKARFSTNGGFSYVDVRDAAQVHVLVAEKGRRGERYIATGHNLDNRSFIHAVIRVYDRPIPKPIMVPRFVAQMAVASKAQKAIKSGKEPNMTPDCLAYSLTPGYFSNAKATKELGATFRPIEESIGDAIAYFKKRGFIREG